MSRATQIVNINELSTGYKVGKDTKQVSSNLNLSIKKSSFIALLGPNGCGKSTLLRTIAGLQNSLHGSVCIDTINIEKLKSKQKARLLSLVLTDRITSAYLIVKDIVGIGRYPHIGSMSVLSDNDKIIIKEALKKCNLEHYAQTPYSDLSDGEKQRVMLARALAQDTPLMMLDEPTAHLDLPNRVGLMQMLKNLAKETDKAILLSTHELDLALQWCDGIWLMDEKGVVTIGTPEDLVLNGSFSKVFSSENFLFDIASGTFKMKQTPIANIYISGDNIKKEWTQRAIKRKGFALTTNKETADLSITIEADKWIINTANSTEIFATIADLLAFINTQLCTK